MKKGGKRVLSFGGKSLKNRKKSKRKSKHGGEVAASIGPDQIVERGEVAAFIGSDLIADRDKLAQLHPINFLMTPEGVLAKSGSWRAGLLDAWLSGA